MSKTILSLFAASSLLIDVPAVLPAFAADSTQSDDEYRTSNQRQLIL